jgi:hypothetical protein
MDVCLIPFRSTPLTRGVNPNKLHEYFALGKPVVATDFSPFMQAFVPLAWVASTPEKFVQAVRAALAAPGDGRHGATARATTAGMRPRRVWWGCSKNWRASR